MNTHVIITNVKTKSLKSLIARVLLKWTSNYVTAMSKALYPFNSIETEDNNDTYRIFYK